MNCIIINKSTRRERLMIMDLLIILKKDFVTKINHSTDCVVSKHTEFYTHTNEYNQSLMFAVFF